jgi:glycine oxidase
MAAAGLLTPFAEAADGDSTVATMGSQAMDLWRRDAALLGDGIDWHARGSLAVARRGEDAELEQWLMRLQRHAPHATIEPLDLMTMEDACPGLRESGVSGVKILGEGAVDGRRLLDRLDTLMQTLPVTVRRGISVERIAPHHLVTDEPATYEADVVIDCRGLGARDDLPDLRSVRGELIELDTPDFRLALPLRVHHPHHPIYLAPQRHGRVLVGATMIESDDDGAISVRSALELLSTAYGIHAALRHARVVDTRVGRRPAFFDHQPRLTAAPGLMRLNGMYRHGFLLAPWWAERVLEALEIP